MLIYHTALSEMKFLQFFHVWTTLVSLSLNVLCEEQEQESANYGNDEKTDDATMLASSVELLSSPSSKTMNADADRDAILQEEEKLRAESISAKMQEMRKKFLHRRNDVSTAKTGLPHYTENQEIPPKEQEDSPHTYGKQEVYEPKEGIHSGQTHNDRAGESTSRGKHETESSINIKSVIDLKSSIEEKSASDIHSASPTQGHSANSKQLVIQLELGLPQSTSENDRQRMSEAQAHQHVVEQNEKDVLHSRLSTTNSVASSITMNAELSSGTSYSNIHTKLEAAERAASQREVVSVGKANDRHTRTLSVNGNIMRKSDEVFMERMDDLSNSNGHREELLVNFASQESGKKEFTLDDSRSFAYAVDGRDIDYESEQEDNVNDGNGEADDLYDQDDGDNEEMMCGNKLIELTSAQEVFCRKTDKDTSGLQANSDILEKMVNAQSMNVEDTNSIARIIARGSKQLVEGQKQATVLVVGSIGDRVGGGTESNSELEHTSIDGLQYVGYNTYLEENEDPAENNDDLPKISSGSSHLSANPLSGSEKARRGVQKSSSQSMQIEQHHLSEKFIPNFRGEIRTNTKAENAMDSEIKSLQMMQTADYVTGHRRFTSIGDSSDKRVADFQELDVSANDVNDLVPNNYQTAAGKIAFDEYFDPELLLNEIPPDNLEFILAAGGLNRQLQTADSARDREMNDFEEISVEMVKPDFELNEKLVQEKIVSNVDTLAAVAVGDIRRQERAPRAEQTQLSSPLGVIHHPQKTSTESGTSNDMESIAALNWKGLGIDIDSFQLKPVIVDSTVTFADSEHMKLSGNDFESQLFFDQREPAHDSKPYESSVASGLNYEYTSSDVGDGLPVPVLANDHTHQMDMERCWLEDADWDEACIAFRTKEKEKLLNNPHNEGTAVAFQPGSGEGPIESHKTVIGSQGDKMELVEEFSEPDDKGKGFEESLSENSTDQYGISHSTGNELLTDEADVGSDVASPPGVSIGKGSQNADLEDGNAADNIDEVFLQTEVSTENATELPSLSGFETIVELGETKQREDVSHSGITRDDLIQESMSAAIEDVTEEKYSDNSNVQPAWYDENEFVDRAGSSLPSDSSSEQVTAASFTPESFVGVAEEPLSNVTPETERLPVDEKWSVAATLLNSLGLLTSSVEFIIDAPRMINHAPKPENNKKENFYAAQKGKDDSGKEIAGLHAKIKEAENLQQKCASQITQLTSELQKMKLERDSAQQKLSQQMAQVAELTSQQAVQSQSLSQLAESNQMLQTNLQQMTDVAAAWEAHYYQLNGLYQQMQSSQANHDTHIQSLQGELVVLQTTKDQALLEMEKMKERISDLMRETAKFNQESSMKQKELEAYRIELDKLRSSYRELRLLESDCIDTATLSKESFEEGDDVVNYVDKSASGSASAEMKPQDNRAMMVEKLLKTMADFSQVSTQLATVEDERNSLKVALATEIEQRMKLEDELHALSSQLELETVNRQSAESELKQASLKMDVLSTFYNNSKPDGSGLSELNDTTGVLAGQYKEKIEELQKQMKLAELEFKKQIAVEEKRANENWLAARQSEREAVQYKMETQLLKDRLAELQNKLEMASTEKRKTLAERTKSPSSNDDRNSSFSSERLPPFVPPIPPPPPPFYRYRSPFPPMMPPYGERPPHLPPLSSWPSPSLKTRETLPFDCYVDDRVGQGPSSFLQERSPSVRGDKLPPRRPSPRSPPVTDLSLMTTSSSGTRLSDSSDLSERPVLQQSYHSRNDRDRPDQVEGSRLRQVPPASHRREARYTDYGQDQRERYQHGSTH